MKRMSAEKAEIVRKHLALLQERYDLSNRAASGVTMSRNKPVQQRVRVKLSSGITWDQLAGMTPEAVKERGVFPAGFYPLPHPNHGEGGMLFPKFEIDEIKKQENRDLTRFDLDFDVPDHFLPEFPPPMFLTTRPDLGDVSKGKLVTIDNFYELFNGILNPKQIEGLRLLVTPFPQQQFNQTEDRRTTQSSRGVACLDCHANGHTNRATHLVGDIRPQEFRHRINTPSLRGVNMQRLFGSQRALRSVEDFTEFEQRAAYFDGDPVIATKKGINILDRGHQVHAMAEFQALLDFPPAPKLNVEGKLDPRKASQAELRRGALAFVPLLLIAILLIDGRLGVSSIGVIAALVAGLALMIALVGASATGTVSDLVTNARVQLHSVFVTGLREASHHLFLGTGTGSDTNAARYVSGAFSATGGWQESYLAKSILELGIVGLALIATVFGSILVRGLRIRRRLRDPGLIAMASAILGLMIWGIVYTVKAQYLDFDPLNLYFWLFTGILFKLAVLDREETPPPQRPPETKSVPPASQAVRAPQHA